MLESKKLNFHLTQNRVAILMGVFNGSKYIEDQVKSIEKQTHENWCLIVSDDGSTDNSADLLKELTFGWDPDRIQIRQGPNKGFCQNFLSMACDKNIRSAYYAFADQDDVWLPKKLEVAIKHIEDNADPDVPYLYCGRTAYVRDDLLIYSLSPLFVYPRTFRNALIQSIAGGNTMVFNHAAKTLIESAGLQQAVSHDWWLYQLISGSGGVVYYDPLPQILYRQHPDALVGGRVSILDKFERVKLVIRGQFRSWCDKNIEALQNSRHCLDYNSQQILDLFVKLRASTLKHRFRMLEVCGLYRQTWRGTVSLMVAALFKKI